MPRRLLPFDAYVDRRGPDECWEWTGRRNDDGYGIYRHGAKDVGAHRLAWTRAHGPIPDGLVVCHTCDNPPCVNTAHHFLGTVAVNNADRAAKGRSKGVFRPGQPDHPATLRRGAAHWRAKLTDHDVAEIRRRRLLGASTVALGREFAVNPATISRIARGIWRVQ